jgi:hypothetical protein
LEQVRKEIMFCDGIKGRPPLRKIARRKENSSLDFLHEATLDVLYLLLLCCMQVGVLCKLIAERMSWTSWASLDPEISMVHNAKVEA